jgi:hypothetical protein
MEKNFEVTCPHCDGKIYGTLKLATGAQGVDAFGFPVGQEVEPRTITPPPEPAFDKSLWRPAFVIPRTRNFTVIMPDGTERKLRGGTVMPAYYEGDLNSVSYQFKLQFPRQPCGTAD